MFNKKECNCTGLKSDGNWRCNCSCKGCRNQKPCDVTIKSGKRCKSCK